MLIINIKQKTQAANVYAQDINSVKPEWGLMQGTCLKETAAWARA